MSFEDKKGEIYFYRRDNESGSYIVKTRNIGDNIDRKRYELGNYYETKEQAESAAPALS